MSPATLESLVLDPAEAINNRTAFEITDWVDLEGPDYGTAAIDAFMAEKDRGAVSVDFTVPNREITIPLKGVSRGGTTWPTALASFQSKVALFQKEGGVLKRLTNSGGTVYADIVDASLTATSTPGWESAQELDLEATMTLTAIPDWYGAEVQLADHTESTAAELVFTETGIDGDYPARVRVVVDDDQAADQRGLIWGFRSRHYSSASTAALKYEAETLTNLDTAADAALSGASGGTVVTHGTLATDWTPVLNTNVGGVYMTHTGTYRLWGRVYSGSGTAVQARVVWNVGDLVNPVANEAWRLPVASQFLAHDFGEIRLDPPPVGTHRWQAMFQAKGDAGSENFSVDKIWMVPVDEGYGVLRAPVNISRGAATYSARSSFTTESGAITGDSLAVGGTWTGAGDADDFTESSDVAIRSADSDTSTNPANGRIVTASTPTLTDTVVQADIKFSVAGVVSTPVYGVVARYTNTSNFVYAGILDLNPSSSGYWLAIGQLNAGSWTPDLGVVRLSGVGLSTYYTIRLFAATNGYLQATLSQPGGSKPMAMVTAMLASGILTSGKVGLIDWNAGTLAGTRSYDNFAAWVPNSDAVTYASQSCQLTTDGHFREDSTGSAYGPVALQQGDLPRLPVAGLEGRTTEVFLKSSRGDLDTIPDSHSSTDYGDDISARITYQPSWLHVPGT